MADFDLIIRNGTVVDGTGSDPHICDVAIVGDRIAAVGSIDGSADKQIDASGLLVTPGFVDIHTHYDGQAIWSDRLIPSSRHGVTTAVMGNCGVGFAPCHPEDHEELVTLMEGVEDIPGIVIREGLTWDWETFPEYLDQLEKRARDIDVAAYLPHSPLRVYVMGERALRREAATRDDLDEMTRLAREALDAGALGFATSRTKHHHNSRGERIPSFDTDKEELHAIAGALREAGRGVIQVTPNFAADTMRDEILFFIDVAKASKRPVMLTLTQIHEDPTAWRNHLQLIADANKNEEARVSVQVFPRAPGVLLGFSLSVHPFIFCPSYRVLADLPSEVRLRELARPQFRARLLAEEPVDDGNVLFGAVRDFAHMYLLEKRPNYEPHVGESVENLAKARGVRPAELAYDLLLAENGHAMLYLAFVNYADGNLDAAREMMLSEYSVFGLGDGGAHLGLVCDAGYPTFVLTYWTRDRASGKVSLPWAVKALTQDTARAVGLNDRGVIEIGYKADLNIIDYERTSLHRPYVINDLPGGGRRLMDDPDGYVATIVSGIIVYRHGKPTGELPGRVVRGPQVVPAESAEHIPARGGARASAMIE